MRLSGLSVRLILGRTEAELQEGTCGEQIFVIRRYSLPSRKDLQTEHAGQFAIPGTHPYGVVLSEDFWSHLSESKNRLLVPLELLKVYVDKPTGWDYLCFLVARCGAAQRPSKIPHEALVSLFRDTEKQEDRNIIRNLQRYHREIMTFSRGRLKAELIEDGVFQGGGRGRPQKRWALLVKPSTSLFARPQDLIESGFPI